MVFISYSSQDARTAQRICAFLEENGIMCWIAPRDIMPGRAFPAQIVSAIRRCDCFLLVASRHINDSYHTLTEVARAFDCKKPIYPFLIGEMTFSDDYLYYLGQIQWINAYAGLEQGLHTLALAISGAPTPGLKAGDTAVIGAGDSPLARRHEPAGDDGQVRIATFRELLELGMTPLDIARRLVENDYSLYPDMVVENEGTPEQWAEYLSTFPETFRYLINGRNEIVGNWSFLAVSEKIHAAKLARGELAESTFSLNETEYLNLPGDYIGYLLNLSINMGYNSPKNLSLLLRAFLDQLLSYAEDGIFFKAWYVNVFRKDHEAMYRRLGFEYLLDNRNFGKVYTMACTALPARSQFGANPRLLELYHEHFM